MIWHCTIKEILQGPSLLQGTHVHVYEVGAPIYTYSQYYVNIKKSKAIPWNQKCLI